jgi:hypothetical protein
MQVVVPKPSVLLGFQVLSGALFHSEAPFDKLRGTSLSLFETGPRDVIGCPQLGRVGENESSEHPMSHKETNMKKRSTLSMTKRRINAQRVSPPACYQLRDPRQLGQVFDAFEGLSELRRRCAREVAHAKESEQVFGHISFKDDESGLRRWSRLFDRITGCWCILDQSVRDSQIDPTEFQQMYRHLLAARLSWSHAAPQTVPLRLLDHIIDQVKEVLISCATQP